MSNGFSIAAFAMSREEALVHVGSPSTHRGVFVTSTTTPETVCLDFHPLPSGYQTINIHRRTNAPRLVGKMGAIVLGKLVTPFELRCAVDPARVITLCGNALGHLVMANTIDSQGNVEVAQIILNRRCTTEMWDWLAGWVNQPESKHSITRRGGYSSFDEELEDRALHEEMRQAQERADEGYDDVWAREAKAATP